ncbi:hypothetical protein GCM10023405_45420 [Streptomonospora salina]
MPAHCHGGALGGEGGDDGAADGAGSAGDEDSPAVETEFHRSTPLYSRLINSRLYIIIMGAWKAKRPDALTAR